MPMLGELMDVLVIEFLGLERKRHNSVWQGFEEHFHYRRLS